MHAICLSLSGAHMGTSVTPIDVESLQGHRAVQRAVSDWGPWPTCAIKEKTYTSICMLQNHCNLNSASVCLSTVFLFKLVKSPVFMSLVCDWFSVPSHLNMCGFFFFFQNKQLSCTHLEIFSLYFSGPLTSCMNLMMDHSTLDFQPFFISTTPKYTQQTSNCHLIRFYSIIIHLLSFFWVLY